MRKPILIFLLVMIGFTVIAMVFGCTRKSYVVAVPATGKHYYAKKLRYSKGCVKIYGKRRTKTIVCGKYHVVRVIK